MAIAFDAATGSGFTNPITTSLTWSHTVTGTDPFLIVTGQTSSVGGANMVSGVTYNGVAMTQLGTSLLDASGDYQWFFYLAAPATGANNVVVSVSSNQYGEFVAGSWTGVKQTSPIDQSGTQNLGSGSGNCAVTLTPTITGGQFIGGYGFAGAGSTNPTSGDSTRQFNTFTGVSLALFDQGPLTTSAATMTITPNITASWQILFGIVVFAAPTTAIKTVDGLAQASVKTVDGLAIASVKSINGLQ